MTPQLPLAWLQLTREKTRLMTAIAGIAFADILMFVQVGFQNALYDSALGPHNSINGELVLVNSTYQTIFSMKNFSRRQLYRVRSIEGVRSVSPVYIGSADWKNPENGTSRLILAFGVDPVEPTLNLPEVNENIDRLKSIDLVLFDRASRPEYGPIANLFQKDPNLEVEVNEVRLNVVELFTLGATFSAEGNLVTSDLTFLRIFDDRDPDDIEVGVIQLESDTDIERVKQEIDRIISSEVKVLTREEFASAEREYWANSTGIGFIFDLGMFVGFIVGLVIVYQILYSDVSDHLPEYATLKAMGYRDSYLLKVLIQEAIILAILGYLPGLGVSWWLYEMTRKSTLLPIFMTTSRAVAMLSITIFMCAISAAIAVRKLREADPADVF
ncbi:MAG: FtsX-like permease family protein [Cyanobacteria bacterium SID2]|nr:FtsX-like permease family protein [Cyanobacteria bacterium SID2]